MLSFFGQPIVINILPEGPVLLEVYYNPGFLPLGIDNKLNTFHIHDLPPSILSSPVAGGCTVGPPRAAAG